MDCRPPGSSLHGILQSRIMEWVAMPFSRGYAQPRDRAASLTSPALAGEFFTTNATWEAHSSLCFTVYIYVNPQILTYTSCTPLITVSLFSMSVCLFLFCIYVNLYHFFRFHIQVISYDSFLSLSAYFTKYDHLQTHPCC